jgi:hypothetical protein
LHTLRCAALLALLTLIVLPAAADWSLDLETGIASNTFNRFRVPGTTGTDVSLARDFDVSPVTYQRWRLTYRANDNEEWSVLYAPLTFHASGTPASDVNFNGVTFAAGSNLSGSYTFNSYRLTYRHWFHRDRDFSYAYGFTAKIRDAAIQLSDGTQTTRNANVGLVPLLHLAGRWKMGSHWSLLAETDALAAPQGRAEDLLLALDYKVSDSVNARLGYRIVEGGADNARVYNFATIQYLSAGVSVEF